MVRVRVRVLALVLLAGLVLACPLVASAQEPEPTPEPVVVTVVVPTPMPLHYADNAGNGPQPFMARFYVEVFVIFGVSYWLTRLFNRTQFWLLWTALSIAAAWVSGSSAGAGIVYVFWLASAVVFGLYSGFDRVFGES